MRFVGKSRSARRFIVVGEINSLRLLRRVSPTGLWRSPGAVTTLGLPLKGRDTWGYGSTRENGWYRAKGEVVF